MAYLRSKTPEELRDIAASTVTAQREAGKPAPDWLAEPDQSPSAEAETGSGVLAVAWFGRFRQRRSERASYEAFLRWQEGAGPRDEAEAQQFEELDDQYSWDETPQEEPGPPPWEPAEWSKAEWAPPSG